MSVYKAESVSLERLGDSARTDECTASGTTYFRIKEIDIDQERGLELVEPVSRAIDFDSKEDVTTREVIIGTASYWISHSRPAWYVEGGRNFRLIDVMTVGNTEDEAVDKLNRVKNDAEIYRQQTQEWVSETLVPEIEKIHGVVVALGRGTIYDDSRVPIPGHGNINIILFTEASSQSEGDTQQTLADIKSLAKANKGTDVGCSVYHFLHPTPQSYGFRSEWMDITKTDTPDKVVEFSILSMVDVAAVVSRFGIDESKQIMGPYALRALSAGKPLIDRTGGVFSDFQEGLNRR